MSTLLTPAELDVMQVLWATPDATVQELVDTLGDGRAYTTVATIAHILEQKGFARSEKVGRRRVYRAVEAREGYQRRSARHLFERVFGGDPGALVRALVHGGSVPADELAELSALVAAAREEER